VTGPECANARLAAALRYAQANWLVFPCLSGQKVPATRHGYLDATTDPAKITRWWTRHPEHNLAIVTGNPGPDVLDVDIHPDGNGYAAFNRLHRAGLLDAASAYVRTPSGGLHAYFTGSQQTNGRLPRHHLDFRSRGGYILAPPSHIDGKPYELLKHQDSHGGLDWAAVTRLLDPQQQHRPEHTADLPADTARLAGWVARLRQGNRNDGLFWAANRALDAGLTDLAGLADAARTAGLGDQEITRTLASAQRRVDRPRCPEPPQGGSPQPRDPMPSATVPGHTTASRSAAMPGTSHDREAT
jgi:hypothetical protein